MNIQYNETEKTIEIDDNRRKQMLLINGIIIINLFNATVQLVKSDGHFGFLEIIWAIVGLISIVALFYIIFKESTAKQIAISNIKQLKSKTVFGKKRYSLALINGKHRNLAEVKTTAEVEEILALFSKIGIEN